MLQSTIANIAFDNNNFCWISYPNGIQKFDGKNFTTIPLQEGLPNDKHCLFFNSNDGTLYISHSEGISRYDIKKNKFSHIWKTQPHTKLPARFLGEDDGIIYIYTQQGNIIGISSSNYKVVSSHRTGFPDYSDYADSYPRVSSTLFNHKIAFIHNNSICTWDLRKGILSFKSDPIENISLYMVQMKSEHEVLFYTYKPAGTIKIINTATNTIRLLPVRQAAGVTFSRCGVYYWQGKFLLNINNRIFETDSSLQVLKNELVNFQNQPFADISGFSVLKEDRLGNLYIQTISNGLKKILHSNYPIRYYKKGDSKENFIQGILPDKKNNRILAGANKNGILVYDTLQRFIKHIPLNHPDGTAASPNCILKTPGGDYLVFVLSENHAWKISSELNSITKIPFESQVPAGKKRGVEYFSNIAFQNEQYAIVQSQNTIYKIDFTGSRISIKEFFVADGYIMSGIYYPPYVITHANDNLIFLDPVSLTHKKKLSFDSTGYVRCFAISPDNKLYIGSNNGIFITDTSGKTLQHMNRQTGLPDDCIYAMGFDEPGNLWCSTNKGILKMQGNRSVLQLTKEDGLQENEFNTNSFARAADGELFFGGVNGLSSFYPRAISNHPEQLNIIFTSVRANGEDAVINTAAWEAESIILPYNKNSLSFDFIAMGNYNADQYIYQYRMTGADKEWSQHNGLQTVRYSLPPGKYTFQVYASRTFDYTAKPIKELTIIIRPPFWKSWWFRIVAALLVVSILGFIINVNNKRKFEKKLQQLENERQLKEERERISKDLHDSLGAYANAVLYNTELLEKAKEETRQQELISDLKFASKDIITSLRETVWALKKESYTAEDCLVRIRNFIQPFAKYYNHIHFKVEGEAPPLLSLHYTKALNLVRIIQEAVSNSIKHASPSLICISSFFTEKKWVLRITDDGKGFKPDIMKEEEKGNGLYNMEYRAAESGLSLHIKSETNKGTQITITV
jgi:signal transduction histidine kinase